MRIPSVDKYTIGKLNSSLFAEVFVLKKTGEFHDNTDDFWILHEETKKNAPNHGNLIILSDGVSSFNGARIASEIFTREFVDSYYRDPLNNNIKLTAMRIIKSINEWLYKVGVCDTENGPMGAAFCLVIFDDNLANIFSAGDVLSLVLRDGKIIFSSRIDREFSKNGELLSNGVGLKESIVINYEHIKIIENDIILLCSDGIHDFVPKSKLEKIISSEKPDKAISMIHELAIENGSKDDVTSILIDLKKCHYNRPVKIYDVIHNIDLEKNTRIKDGVIDGEYIIERKIYESESCSVFLCHKKSNYNELLALKIPSKRIIENSEMLSLFMLEGWASSVIRSKYVVDIINYPYLKQNGIYHVMPYYKGYTLTSLIINELDLETWVNVATQLCKAVYDINRKNIIHRDIKPDNIIISGDGDLKILDLGSIFVPGVVGISARRNVGTTPYMAPELFNGSDGDSRSDVYAIAVTLFQCYCKGEYPYGNNVNYAFLRYRKDTPIWIIEIINKGIAYNPENRYCDSMEMLYDIEQNSKNNKISRKKLRKKLYLVNCKVEVVVLRTIVLILIITMFIL